MKKPNAERQVSDLSAKQRAMLLDHIDGRVEVIVSLNGVLASVRNSLMKIGLLRQDVAGPASPRPKATVLTERGRMVLGGLLGAYADALERAGLLAQDSDRPLEILRRLKAQAASKSAGLAQVGAETAKSPARLV